MNPNWLVGKTIAAVELNAEPDRRGGKAHRPVIRFTDGSSISFTTQETDGGWYGTSINYRRKPKK